MFVTKFLKILYNLYEEILNSIFIIHSSTKFIQLFDSWHAAEVEKDLFYRAMLKIHKVTKVVPSSVCSDAVL